MRERQEESEGGAGGRAKWISPLLWDPAAAKLHLDQQLEFVGYIFWSSRAGLHQKWCDWFLANIPL